MLIPIDPPFDLKNTLYSGQSFNWRLEAGWYVGVIFKNVLSLRQVEGSIEFTSGPDPEVTIAPLLADYLSINIDIDKIYSSIGKDSRIDTSINEYQGMRILRQDPWECLISFIISSFSNIQRISKHVQDLAVRYGSIVNHEGLQHNTFPGPETLKCVGERQLRDIGLGYRAPYVARTASMVAQGDIDLFALREASYEEALESLLRLPGVGDKVANCVMLFSLDKPNAFPIDVWVKRALGDWYFGPKDNLSIPKMREWAQDYFGPYAGYANQYLFHSRRLQTNKKQPSKIQAN